MERSIALAALQESEIFLNEVAEGSVGHGASAADRDAELRIERNPASPAARQIVQQFLDVVIQKVPEDCFLSISSNRKIPHNLNKLSALRFFAQSLF